MDKRTHKTLRVIAKLAQLGGIVVALYGLFALVPVITALNDADAQKATDQYEALDKKLQKIQDKFKEIQEKIEDNDKKKKPKEPPPACCDPNIEGEVLAQAVLIISKYNDDAGATGNPSTLDPQIIQEKQNEDGYMWWTFTGGLIVAFGMVLEFTALVIGSQNATSNVDDTDDYGRPAPL